MAEGSKMVEIIIGHTSTILPGTTANGHTHQWTLFVKPANKEYDNFPDNKFVQKVKFQIHESFPNPVRTISKPPFKITETGFASFEAMVDIYLNLPHQKPHHLQYELVLFNGETDTQEQIRKLVIRDDSLPPAFLEQIKKYGKSKKRKPSMASSHSSRRSQSPQESRKSKRASSEEHRHQKSSVPKIEVESPRQAEKEKKKSSQRSRSPEHKEKSVKTEKIRTPEEVTKKVNSCTDPYVIYKLSEFLLTLPKTTLNETTLKLHFDLSKSSPETLAQICKILKMKKSKN